MNDTGFMGSFQRLGDLFRNRQSFVDGDRTLCDPICQGRPSTNSNTNARVSSVSSRP